MLARASPFAVALYLHAVFDQRAFPGESDIFIGLCWLVISDQAVFGININFSSSPLPLDTQH